MARRPHILIYGALALSLAVNLAGVGFLLASDDRGKPRRTVDDTIEFVSKRYPAAVGDAVRAQLETRRAELGRTLGEMQAARRATREAIAADPPDPAKLEGAFETSREKSANFQKVIHGAIVQAVPALPLDERAKVVRSERD